jgi:hypothetical protein
VVLGGSVLVGAAVDMAAKAPFSLCLMDVAQLTEMSFAAQYFYSSWYNSGDQSEIVKAVIYLIQGWKVGLNLRCFGRTHKILT